MENKRKLNIIDESGRVIGEATREEIHKKGLLHAEIHVWFFTPDGEIIFQHRAKNKDTFPDLLDATVGGHVEIGQTARQAAVREIEEETGLRVEEGELIPIATTITKNFDPATGNTNHPYREVFAYKFLGAIGDLRIEKGKSLGFEKWGIEKLYNLTDEEKKKFIPHLISQETFGIYRKIKTMIENK